jgi:hypothetical protein
MLKINYKPDCNFVFHVSCGIQSAKMKNYSFWHFFAGRKGGVFFFEHRHVYDYNVIYTRVKVYNSNFIQPLLYTCPALFR